MPVMGARLDYFIGSFVHGVFPRDHSLVTVDNHALCNVVILYSDGNHSYIMDQVKCLHDCRRSINRHQALIGHL